MNEVTQILAAIEQGDPNAASQLLPLVYDELRRLAAAQMARELPGQTIDATALVHEAYLRLAGEQKFDGRGHFFAAAAEAMRRILIDSARRKRRHKRGGDRRRQPLDVDQVAAPEMAEDLLALDEALTKFAAVDPQTAQLVSLRYFAGLTLKEVADTLGVAPRTADAHWAYARAGLMAEMQRQGGPASPNQGDCPRE